jgi:hypothetical protein
MYNQANRLSGLLESNLEILFLELHLARQPVSLAAFRNFF